MLVYSVNLCLIFLGIQLDKRLTWGDNIDHNCSKVTSRIYALRNLAKLKIHTANGIFLLNQPSRMELDSGGIATLNTSLMEYLDCRKWQQV